MNLEEKHSKVSIKITYARALKQVENVVHPSVKPSILKRLEKTAINHLNNRNQTYMQLNKDINTANLTNLQIIHLLLEAKKDKTQNIQVYPDYKHQHIPILRMDKSNIQMELVTSLRLIHFKYL